MYTRFDKSTNINIIVAMKTDEVAFAKALADETRQEIMQHLCCEWLSVSDLVEKLAGRVNQPTVSHHLKKLAEIGLVSVRRCAVATWSGALRLTMSTERTMWCPLANPSSVGFFCLKVSITINIPIRRRLER